MSPPLALDDRERGWWEKIGIGVGQTFTGFAKIPAFGFNNLSDVIDRTFDSVEENLKSREQARDLESQKRACDEFMTLARERWEKENAARDDSAGYRKKTRNGAGSQEIDSGWQAWCTRVVFEELLFMSQFLVDLLQEIHREHMSSDRALLGHIIRGEDDYGMLLAMVAGWFLQESWTWATVVESNSVTCEVLESLRRSSEAADLASRLRGALGPLRAVGCTISRTALGIIRRRIAELDTDVAAPFFAKAEYWYGMGESISRVVAAAGLDQRKGGRGKRVSMLKRGRAVMRKFLRVTRDRERHLGRLFGQGLLIDDGRQFVALGEIERITLPPRLRSDGTPRPRKQSQRTEEVVVFHRCGREQGGSMDSDTNIKDYLTVTELKDLCLLLGLHHSENIKPRVVGDTVYMAAHGNAQEEKDHDGGTTTSIEPISSTESVLKMRTRSRPIRVDSTAAAYFKGSCMLELDHVSADEEELARPSTVVRWIAIANFPLEDGRGHAGTGTARAKNKKTAPAAGPPSKKVRRFYSFKAQKCLFESVDAAGVVESVLSTSRASRWRKSRNAHAARDELEKVRAFVEPFLGDERTCPESRDVKDAEKLILNMPFDALVPDRSGKHPLMDLTAKLCKTGCTYIDASSSPDVQKNESGDNFTRDRRSEQHLRAQVMVALHLSAKAAVVSERLSRMLGTNLHGAPANTIHEPPVSGEGPPPPRMVLGDPSRHSNANHTYFGYEQTVAIGGFLDDARVKFWRDIEEMRRECVNHFSPESAHWHCQALRRQLSPKIDAHGTTSFDPGPGAPESKPGLLSSSGVSSTLVAFAETSTTDDCSAAGVQRLIDEFCVTASRISFLKCAMDPPLRVREPKNLINRLGADLKKFLDGPGSQTAAESCWESWMAAEQSVVGSAHFLSIPEGSRDLIVEKLKTNRKAREQKYAPKLVRVLIDEQNKDQPEAKVRAEKRSWWSRSYDLLQKHVTGTAASDRERQQTVAELFEQDMEKADELVDRLALQLTRTRLARRLRSSGAILAAEQDTLRMVLDAVQEDSADHAEESDGMTEEHVSEGDSESDTEALPSLSHQYEDERQQRRRQPQPHPLRRKKCRRRYTRQMRTSYTFVRDNCRPGFRVVDALSSNPRVVDIAVKPGTEKAEFRGLKKGFFSKGRVGRQTPAAVPSSLRINQDDHDCSAKIKKEERPTAAEVASGTILAPPPAGAEAVGFASSGSLFLRDDEDDEDAQVQQESDNAHTSSRGGALAAPVPKKQYTIEDALRDGQYRLKSCKSHVKYERIMRDTACPLKPLRQVVVLRSDFKFEKFRTKKTHDTDAILSFLRKNDEEWEEHKERFCVRDNESEDDEVDAEDCGQGQRRIADGADPSPGRAALKPMNGKE